MCIAESLAPATMLGYHSLRDVGGDLALLDPDEAVVQPSWHAQLLAVCQRHAQHTHMPVRPVDRRLGGVHYAVQRSPTEAVPQLHCACVIIDSQGKIVPPVGG